MRSVKQRLMTLFHVLRNPQAKPADIEHLEKRLDRVDKRIEEEKRRRILQDGVDAARRSRA